MLLLLLSDSFDCTERALYFNASSSFLRHEMVKTSKKPVWCDVADCCIFGSQCVIERKRERKREGEGRDSPLHPISHD